MDKYLKINRWLKMRYHEDGWLTIERGGKPTRYTILDRAFFRRYVLEDENGTL